MNDPVSLSVSPEIIKPIIQAKIQAAIIDALGGNATLIQNSVLAIMNAKVDSNGKFSSNGYGSEKPLITWLCEELVKRSAEEAVREYFSTKKSLLVKEFEKQFAARKKSIAEKMVDGIFNSTKSEWEFILRVDYAGGKS